MTNTLAEISPLQVQPGDSLGSHPPGQLRGSHAKPVLKTKFWRSWSAVIVSTVGLLVSCALAVSHHVFYSALDGTAVGSTERQQWSLRIGTFFAVAFATTLRLAITSAYFQYIWLTLKRKNVSLASIDDAFDALGDVWSLLSPRLVTKLPLVVVIGLVFWSTNVVTLFPPATLSTTGADAAGSILILRPSLMYIDTLDTPTPYVYSGNVSSAALEDAFDRVLESGEEGLPALVESELSYSYKSSMYLPRVSCEEMGANAARDFRSEIEKVIDIILTREALSGADFDVENVTVDDDFQFTYQKVFWEGEEVANTSKPLAGRLHYIAWAETLNAENEDWSISDSFLLRDMIEHPEASIMYDSSLYIAWANLDGPGVNVSRCELYNSSWDVSVEVRRGEVYLFSQDMIEQGNQLSSNRALTEINRSKPSSLALALRAWMHPFYSEVQGCAVYLRELADTWETWDNVPTFLANSPEYQQYLEYRESSLVTPIESKLAYNRRIETVSQDYSSSLMSVPDLCDEVRVETKNSGRHIIYQYKAKNLIVAYAAALLATLTVVAIGLRAFILNGSVTYDRKVSTIAAAMQSHEMPEVLKYAPVGSASVDSRVAKVRLRLESYNVGASDEVENLRLRGYRFVPE